MKLPTTFIAYMDTSAQPSLDASASRLYTDTIKKSEMILPGRERLLHALNTLKTEMPSSTNLNSIDNLIERLSRGSQARAKFVASHIDKGIAFQIRALRDRQELSQEALAAKVGMNQNAISRLESPERGRPTITTLKRIAEAFDVALVVRFVPFSKLAKWVAGVPFVEEGLSSETLAAPKFEEELRNRAFVTRTESITPSLPLLPQKQNATEDVKLAFTPVPVDQEPLLKERAYA